MPGRQRLWFIAIGCSLVIAACAGSSNGTTTAENTEPAPPVHHHRRHRTDGGVASESPDNRGSQPAVGSSNTAGTSASSEPAPDNGLALPPSSGGSSAPTTATFGTPTVAQSSAASVRVRWADENGGRAICEGNDARPAPFCGQCPTEPTNAEIVRAFVPFEREVLDCGPPADRDGRLPLRVQFSNAGVPLEVRFPGVQISHHVALCVARALCRSHVPNFQSSSALVDYQFVVLVPETAP